jgi:hypothetical protein
MKNLLGSRGHVFSQNTSCEMSKWQKENLLFFRIRPTVFADATAAEMPFRN